MTAAGTVSSAKHQENAGRLSENRSKDVRTFFSINSEQLNVTRAEIALVNFLIEHNLPLATADHAHIISLPNVSHPILCDISPLVQHKAVCD